MSTTNVRRLRKDTGKAARGTRASVEYQLYGTKGTQRWRQNRSEMTTRAAALTCDLESPEAFVERAEYLTDKHGRQVESRSLIQSFSKDEFDPAVRADVQRVNDLGYLLAKELHPNSDVLVVTHVDSAGGHPHNHISVINHDNVTGKALQGNHLHWQVTKVNDKVMAEQGAWITERGRAHGTRHWEWLRDSKGWSQFETELGDKIADALNDPLSVDETTYRKVLAEKGVELEETTHEIKASADGSTHARESIGWTYKMRDETGVRPRMRRRAASRLANDFTKNGVQLFLDDNAFKAKVERDQQVQQEKRAQEHAARVSAAMEERAAAAREAERQRVQEVIEAQHAKTEQARIAYESAFAEYQNKRVDYRLDIEEGESRDGERSGGEDARQATSDHGAAEPRRDVPAVRRDDDNARGHTSNDQRPGRPDSEDIDVERARRGIATARAATAGRDSDIATKGPRKPVTERDLLRAKWARERDAIATEEDREFDSGPEL